VRLAYPPGAVSLSFPPTMRPRNARGCHGCRAAMDRHLVSPDRFEEFGEERVISGFAAI